MIRQNKIEALKRKYEELYSASQTILDKIHAMEMEDDEETRASMLGKCFRMNAGEGGENETPSWHGYARVESFDTNFQPVGTVVNIYFHKRCKITNLELNRVLYVDWLNNGVQIRNKKFDRLLKDVKQSIKLNNELL